MRSHRRPRRPAAERAVWRTRGSASGAGNPHCLLSESDGWRLSGRGCVCGGWEGIAYAAELGLDCNAGLPMEPRRDEPLPMMVTTTTATPQNQRHSKLEKNHIDGGRLRSDSARRGNGSTAWWWLKEGHGRPPSRGVCTIMGAPPSSEGRTVRRSKAVQLPGLVTARDGRTARTARPDRS